VFDIDRWAHRTPGRAAGISSIVSQGFPGVSFTVICLVFAGFISCGLLAYGGIIGAGNAARPWNLAGDSLVRSRDYIVVECNDTLILTIYLLAQRQFEIRGSGKQPAWFGVTGIRQTEGEITDATDFWVQSKITQSADNTVGPSQPSRAAATGQWTQSGTIESFWRFTSTHVTLPASGRFDNRLLAVSLRAS